MNEIDLWESEISEQSSIQEEKIYNFYDDNTTPLQEGKITDAFKKILKKSSKRFNKFKDEIRKTSSTDDGIADLMLDGDSYYALLKNYTICGHKIMGCVKNNFTVSKYMKNTPEVRAKLARCKMSYVNNFAELFSSVITNKDFEEIKALAEKENPDIFKNGTKFDSLFKQSTETILCEMQSETAAYAMLPYRYNDDENIYCLLTFSYDYISGTFRKTYEISKFTTA